ncbi:hypothetical protein GLT81_00650 [Nanohaloarchaea archaeon]|nr:hypothetical protein [Candidatus Nanohaloarchaea archaeon]
MLAVSASKKLLITVTLAMLLLQPAFSLNPSSDVELNLEPKNITNVSLSLNPRNSSPVSTELEVKPLRANWTGYTPSYGNGTFVVNISFEPDEPAHYRYRWIVKNGSYSRFPAKNLGFTIPSENESIRDDSLRFTNNVSKRSKETFCSYKQNDFSCGYVNIQALKISKNAMAYEITSNSSYLDRALNYSLSGYTKSGVREPCDHENNDFSCDPEVIVGDGVNTTSGRSQGRLISSLWTVFQVSENQTVRELAKNYTLGAAEDCAVWNNTKFGEIDYVCSSAKGQGSMMQGYWKAYQITGNETYRKKASKLSFTNFTFNSTSPTVMRGLMSGYESTGNSTYINQSERIAKDYISKIDGNITSNITENISSSGFFELGIGLFEASEATNQYGFYRNGIRQLDYNTSRLNFSCSAATGNYTCFSPIQQSLASLMYLKGFTDKKDLRPSISNPEFNQRPVTGENLTIDFEMQGKVEEPTLKFKQRGGNYTDCPISFFEGCQIDSSQISEQAVYQYYVNSSELRFPGINGTFKTGISIQNDEKAETAKGFADTNNELNAFCTIWSGDYSCEEENYQASMINGITESFRNTENLTYRQKALKLGRPPIFKDDTQSGFSCRPEAGDYSCDTASVQESLTGSVRQGNLIESLFSLYAATEEPEPYELAKKYAVNAPSDCNVWNNSFSCNSSEGQASMIQGYWKAYEVTSNSTYRDIALNLSEESLNMRPSRKLASAQWQSYSLTSNKTFEKSAQNITDKKSQSCYGNNCSVLNYYFSGEMYRDGYIHGNSSYLENYQTLLNGETTSGGDCGPGKDDFSCKNPGLQGKMTELFGEYSRYAPVTLKSDEGFSVSTNTPTVGQTTQGVCTLTNQLPNTTLENVEFSLGLSEGLSTSSNISKQTGDLNYTNTSTVTWDITGDQQGEQTATCNVESSNGLTEVLQRSLQVQEAETESDSDDSDSSEESSSGGAGGSGITIQPKNYTIKYDSNPSEYEPNNSFLKRIGINTTLKEFNLSDESCFTGRRNVLENRNTLTFNYNCEADGVLILDEVNRSLNVHKLRKPFEPVSITYQFSRNLSAPTVIEYREIPPLEMEVDYNIASSQREDLYVNVNVNRRARCAVLVNGDQILNQSVSDQASIPISKAYGESDIEVNCGYLNSSYSYVGETKIEEVTNTETETLFPLAVIMIGGLFFSTIAFYYRVVLLSVSNNILMRGKNISLRFINLVRANIFKILFAIYLRRFKRKVTSGDSVGAIQIFQKLSKFSAKEAAENLESMDMNLMRGVRLYMLLEMVEESVNEGAGMPEMAENLDELVESYLKDVDNPEMENLIADKINEIAEMT